jgi:hypothetical protein
MADVQVGTLPQPCQILAPGSQSLRTVTYQGVAWLAVLSMTWPVLETSWPAPATVWQAARSGARPRNASRSRLGSAILLHMKFTLLSGFGAGHAKPLVFDAGCWGSGAPGTSYQPTAFEAGSCRRRRLINFLRETDPPATRSARLFLRKLRDLDCRTKTFSCSICGADGALALEDPCKDTGWRITASIRAWKHHPAAVKRMTEPKRRSYHPVGGELPGRKSDGPRCPAAISSSTRSHVSATLTGRPTWIPGPRWAFFGTQSRKHLRLDRSPGLGDWRRSNVRHRQW